MANRPDKYAGLSDREAFIEIQLDLKQTVRMIRQQSEGIADKELLDYVRLKLEAMTGGLPDDT
jgi:hypothetical protein